MKIKVGTRGSKLALAQAQWVIKTLKSIHPNVEFDISIIKTIGDVVGKTFSKIGTQGIFVKEIEDALLSEKIDIAVHSMKDLPTSIPEQLSISAITSKVDPRDCLITNDNIKLDDLPKYSVIGTSSLRRRAVLRDLRDDLKIHEIRGNLDTRLKKLKEGIIDGIIVGMTGLIRFGMEYIATDIFPTDLFVPASGAGALGIETRKNDNRAIELVSRLNDKASEICIKTEREFLEVLGGGCQKPIGVYATITRDEISVSGMVADLDCTNIRRGQVKGNVKEYKGLALELANELK